MPQETTDSFQDLPSLNNQFARTLIGVDAVRIEYTVNNHELELLETCQSQPNKEYMLAGFSAGAPFILNAILAMIRLYHAENPDKSVMWEVILNLSLGIGGLLFGVVFAILMRKDKNKFKTIITNIKAKPLHGLNDAQAPQEKGK